MKSLFRMISVAALAVLTLAACHKDKVVYTPEDGTIDVDNVGYLALGAMEVSVLEDTENIASDASSTRAVNIDDFMVEIFKQKDDNTWNKVDEFLYSNRKEKLELEAGNYRMVLSLGERQEAAWEAPAYGAEEEFTIVRGETVTIEEIVCKLVNIKVTVSYSADIIDQLNPDLTTMTVSTGTPELVYAMTETRAGYFLPVDDAETTTLNLTLKCRYKEGENADKDIIMTNMITGVKPAQWRKINIVIQHASDGNATIGIVCDTWVYNENVEFASSSYLAMEETIPDDIGAPVISFGEHDFNNVYELNDSMFDANGNFKSSINVDVTASAPLTSLVVEASSDNPEFVSTYSAMVDKKIDLCTTTKSNAALALMGYSKVAADATAVQLQFGKQANIMRSFEGTHTYTITAVDSKNRTATATLMVKYGVGGGVVTPVIEWVGYDISQMQTIDPATDTCMIRVTAPLKIKDFMVKIESSVLTKAELESLDPPLTDEFSLVNDTTYFSALTNFGFPTGDAVYGQTYISEDNLNISKFLGLLAMLGSGDHNFIMTVTDMEGNTTEETIQMHFE